MPHPNSAMSPTTALSFFLLAVLVLCLCVCPGLDFERIMTSNFNFYVREGSVSTGEGITVREGNERQHRKLTLIKDPKTVEQKPVPAQINNESKLCRSSCKGVNPWLCDFPLSCMPPDPPGAPSLNEHRGLALLLHRKDCITAKQCLLAYLMIPKAGSTLVKSTMAGTGEVEPMWLSTVHGMDTTNNNPFVFTLMRHPGERIVSAYSTIMSRREGVYGWINEDPISFPEAPADVNDKAAWIQQFKKSIHDMMVSVRENGWYNANKHVVWNAHIIPQVEFMRGIHVSFIGCVGKIHEALGKFQLDTSSQQIENNAYEHSDNMPAQKFASYNLLDDETKALVREIYAEDFKLFLSTCQ
jgi:hypothetical protein